MCDLKFSFHVSNIDQVQVVMFCDPTVYELRFTYVICHGRGQMFAKRHTHVHTTVGKVHVHCLCFSVLQTMIHQLISLKECQSQCIHRLGEFRFDNEEDFLGSYFHYLQYGYHMCKYNG